MTTRALALLALLLPCTAGEDDRSPLSTDPSVAAHVLSTARKDLKGSRDAFKALSPDERGVVKGARDTVAPTAKWRALAPSFGAAADLLDAAGAGTGAGADLCVHMAKSFRAIANELDKDASYLTEEQRDTEPGKRAAETFAAAEKLLAEAAVAELEEIGTAAWALMKRADPRYRAIAFNVNTLARGFATLREMKHDEEAGGAIANAAKLQAALAPYFEGVRAARDEEPVPTPEPEPKPRGGVRRIN